MYGPTGSHDKEAKYKESCAKVSLKYCLKKKNSCNTQFNKTIKRRVH